MWVDALMEIANYRPNGRITIAHAQVHQRSLRIGGERDEIDALQAEQTVHCAIRVDSTCVE